MMSLENALWLAGTVTKAALIALLFYRRAWRTLPIFSLYCVWDLLLDSTNLAVVALCSRIYLTVYTAEIAIDSVFQFAVLVELTWSVLRPIRRIPPSRGARRHLGHDSRHWSGNLAIFGHVYCRYGRHRCACSVHLMQTVIILRVIFFLALAGCSQLLSLSWKDRELQVVTGLGIYSIASLAVAMLHTHQPSYKHYNHLYQFVIGSYICSLLLLGRLVRSKGARP